MSVPDEIVRAAIDIRHRAPDVRDVAAGDGLRHLLGELHERGLIEWKAAMELDGKDIDALQLALNMISYEWPLTPGAKATRAVDGLERILQKAGVEPVYGDA